jgi:hypothetical protein
LRSGFVLSGLSKTGATDAMRSLVEAVRVPGSCCAEHPVRGRSSLLVIVGYQTRIVAPGFR